MKFKIKGKSLKDLKKPLLCIIAGTIAGSLNYEFFMHYNIAIYGWNFGLIFAPLVAGYVETIVAEEFIGEDTGAVSAFILFISTTIYSFILTNPSLGFNFITFGTIIIILQAAFPTLINYLLIVFGLRLATRIWRGIKKIVKSISDKIKRFKYKYILKEPYEPETETIIEYDEAKCSQMINSKNFIFLTGTNEFYKHIINLGHFAATVIIEKDKHLVHSDPLQAELNTLNSLKIGKDECLVKLTNNIKAAGGNGVIDLDIQYSLIGLGGDSYQVTAMGMGVYLK